MNTPHPTSRKVWAEIARASTMYDGIGLRRISRGERSRRLATSAYGAEFDFTSSDEHEYSGKLYVVLGGGGLSLGPVIFVRSPEEGNLLHSIQYTPTC